MKPAPVFTLLDQDGVSRNLSDYLGHWVILYFYPKDDTPGCTTEACSFRDEYEYLQSQGATVIGIGKDSVDSHKKFSEKYKLHFPLLSDEEHKVIESYGSWQLKKFMGKEYMGTNRDTFVINPTGQIVKEYRGVTPREHVGQIVKDLEELKASHA